jgi:hypothetical protein
MKIYQGTPSFLYCRLKQNYKDIFRSCEGLMPYEKFKERIELGKEIHFAGALYQLPKQL